MGIALAVACCGAPAGAAGPVGPAWAQDASEAPGSSQGILPVGLSADSATVVSIARLAGADLDLNDTLVSFRGEVVGEPVNSSSQGSKWVVMQAGGSSVSSIEVLMTNDQIDLIEHYGAYKTKGSTLLVTGIYRVADPSHTGELDVTAYAVSVLDPGGPVDEKVDWRKLRLGLVLVAVGLGLVGLRSYLKWRSRS